MTRWFVTGASGLLGHDLMPLLHDVETSAPAQDEVDVTDATAVLDAIAGHDVVIHLAAWVDPDRAEEEPSAAMAVNGLGTRNVARACAIHHARMVYTSTDYVFDGSASEPYAEDAPVRPVSVYGRGKADGEQAVKEYLPNTGVILRTAWLYGAHGKSFVSTMRDLAVARDHVDVVTDQVGQPTWTADLAERIVDVVRADLSAGIYHATNAGATTWHGLARRVFSALGHNPARVRPTTSYRLARRAFRPPYSVLSHHAWQNTPLAPMRPWEEAFDAALPTVLGEAAKT